MQKAKETKKSRGSVLPMALVFGAFFLVVFSSLLAYVGTQRHVSVKKAEREEAFNIAEAGIEMYRWHIAHELDGKTAAQVKTYWDGTPLAVPSYEREYKDPQGNAVGRFLLEVTEPAEGSTVIDVVSTGWHYSNPDVRRSIKVRFRKPAWSEYVVLADDVMRFGVGTETWGPIHSNNGIQFDGIAHNLVSSAKSTYRDPDTHQDHVGVWTSLADPTQVFLAGTKFPVASIDFASLTGDLAVMKQNAVASGVYVAEAGKNKEGYRLQLKTDGTIDIYTVKMRGNETYHVNKEEFLKTVAIPNNGVVFVEDDVTIAGSINDKKVTIVAADLDHSAKEKNIYIENDITYAGYDGSEVLGLIAQGSIKIGLYSEDNLRIDGALIAKSGNIGRDYYGFFSDPHYYKVDAITIYGALATKYRYGFSWLCDDVYCSGYQTRNIIYDPELLTNIPPFFPTQNSYKMDKWEETQ